jgi:hypothetical protein
MKFPIFPLNGAVLFPNTNLPLNIFEARYINMVDYALSNNRIIGMIQTQSNKGFFKVGCLGKITNFTEAQNGTYQINLEGVERFKINKLIKNVYKFILVDGEKVNFHKNFNPDSVLNGKKILQSFKNYLSIKNIKLNTSEFEPLDALNLAKLICIISPLDYLTKQMLLEFNTATDFCENLISVLEIEINNSQNSSKIN